MVLLCCLPALRRCQESVTLPFLPRNVTPIFVPLLSGLPFRGGARADEDELRCGSLQAPCALCQQASRLCELRVSVKFGDIQLFLTIMSFY